MKNETFENIENHNHDSRNQALISDLFDENELFRLLERYGNSELAVYVQTNLIMENQLLNVLRQDRHYSKELMDELEKIRKTDFLNYS